MFLERNYHWCQQKLTNVYFYQSARSPVLCFSLVMLTHLRYHHNSHSLLSAAHHYHNFSSPVNTKQSFNIHYGVQCILYKLVTKHFKPNMKYFACPCKSHTHTHTHTRTRVCVCVYIYFNTVPGPPPTVNPSNLCWRLAMPAGAHSWDLIFLHISVFQLNQPYKLILHYRWYLEQCVTNQFWQQSHFGILKKI